MMTRAQEEGRGAGSLMQCSSDRVDSKSNYVRRSVKKEKLFILSILLGLFSPFLIRPSSHLTSLNVKELTGKWTKTGREKNKAEELPVTSGSGPQRGHTA